jgi:hypothetical protein
VATAFLAPDDLPQPLLTTHPNVLPEPLAATAGDPLALADAVAALRRFSLVRIVGDGLYVHRLLQTVIRAALDAKTEGAWAAATAMLLRGTVALSRNMPGSPAKWRLSFMEGVKKGSNYSTVPMICRLWAAKWRQSHRVIAQQQCRTRALLHRAVTPSEQ